MVARHFTHKHPQTRLQQVLHVWENYGFIELALVGVIIADNVRWLIGAIEQLQ